MEATVRRGDRCGAVRCGAARWRRMCWCCKGSSEGLRAEERGWPVEALVSSRLSGAGAVGTEEHLLCQNIAGSTLGNCTHCQKSLHFYYSLTYLCMYLYLIFPTHIFNSQILMLPNLFSLTLSRSHALTTAPQSNNARHRAATYSQPSSSQHQQCRTPAINPCKKQTPRNLAWLSY